MKRLLCVCLCLLLLTAFALAVEDIPDQDPDPPVTDIESSQEAEIPEPEPEPELEPSPDELPTESEDTNNDSTPAPPVDDTPDDKYPVGSYVDADGNVWSSDEVSMKIFDFKRVLPCFFSDFGLVHGSCLCRRGVCFSGKKLQGLRCGRYIE